MPAASLPPGPRRPAMLNLVGWVKRPMPYLEQCRDRYGDMFSFRMPNEGTWVFLSDPDAVKQVFTGDPRLLHAGEANVILRPFLGSSSVLLLDDDAHMRQRKLMLPAFHGERMQRYREVMREVAEREFAKWREEEPFALQPRMQAVTLEIILRAVFGADETGGLDRLRTALRDMLETTTSPATMSLLAVMGPTRMEKTPFHKKAMAPVDAAVLEEIRRHRADPGLEDRDDVLSLLLQARYEDGSPMSDKELRDELMTLLVAGHETTATTLAWAVERLMRHPGMLERCAEDEEYVDAAVKETLRLRPVLPVVLRRLVEPMEIGGRLLPAGVSVAPCIHLVHRRADIYPEPRAFRPERFLGTTPGTYTWIPFGGGVRRCLGASFALFEMQVVLSALARKVALRPVRPEAERVTRRAITLTPERGTEVVVCA